MRQSFRANLSKVQEVAEMIVRCIGCGNFFEDCHIQTSFNSSRSWEEIVGKLNSIKLSLIVWEGNNETAWWFYADEKEIFWRGQWTAGRNITVTRTEKNKYLVDCCTGNGKQARDSFLLSYLTK